MCVYVYFYVCWKEFIDFFFLFFSLVSKRLGKEKKWSTVLRKESVLKERQRGVQPTRKVCYSFLMSHKNPTAEKLPLKARCFLKRLFKVCKYHI